MVFICDFQNYLLWVWENLKKIFRMYQLMHLALTESSVPKNFYLTPSTREQVHRYTCKKKIVIIKATRRHYETCNRFLVMLKI